MTVETAQSASSFAPRALDTRPLGSTGLVVSRLGLGLAALGRPAYMTLGRDADIGADRSVEAMERRCHAMLDAAYAAGVRYVDAARSYGFAERFLATWLERRAIAPGVITVGSKWGYTYTGNWQMDAPVHEVKDLSAATLRRQQRESRALLGPYLSLYQIHSATIESGVLDDPDVLAELASLREAGLVVGLTVTGPRQADTIRRALARTIDGRPLFGVVQATWNLLEPSAGAALADARARGVGVIVKEALANGRLTDAHPEPATAALSAVATQIEATSDALAIAAALRQPWADVVLSGAVTPAHLASHLSAVQWSPREIEIPPLAESSAAYWTRRGTLGWT